MCARTRDDVGHHDDAALALAHDLLCDGQDVSRADTLGCRQCGHERGKTTIGPNLWDAVEGKQLQRMTPAPRRSATFQLAQSSAAVPVCTHVANASRSSGVSTSSARDEISS